MLVWFKASAFNKPYRVWIPLKTGRANAVLPRHQKLADVDFTEIHFSLCTKGVGYTYTGMLSNRYSPPSTFAMEKVIVAV